MKQTGLRGIFDRLRSFWKSSDVDIAKRFDLLSEPVAGSMSLVYKARDRKHDRIVALKICDPEKTAAFESRFRNLTKPREGEIAVSLRHENIVTTYEHGLTTRAEHFLVMEYLAGPSLHAVAKAPPAELQARCPQLIRQMANALKAVHDGGYIHRDVRPRNFHCSADLRSVKLIDFGLSLPDLPPFKQAGNRSGSPAYMAPEIARRRPTDRRVDVFAFGVSVYELLTSELPWAGSDSASRGALHDLDAPTPILQRRPDLSQPLATTVMACLAQGAEDRPDSMDTVLARLRGGQT